MKPRSAGMHLGNTFHDNAELWAEHDAGEVSLMAVIDDERPSVVPEILKITPDFFHMYRMPFAGVLKLCRDDYEAGLDTQKARWWGVVKDHLMMTTAGEVFTCYGDDPGVNLLCYGLRNKMRTVVGEWMRQLPANGRVLIIDFVHEGVPNFSPGEVGELDLDGDGIPFAHDPREREAWIKAQLSLIDDYNNSSRAGQRVIANGPAAMSKPFAPLLNGCVCEHFPRYAFGSPWNTPNWHGAVSKSSHNSLWNARPRFRGYDPIILLENAHDDPDDRMAVACIAALFDCYCQWTAGGGDHGRRLVPPDFDMTRLGDSLGAARGFPSQSGRAELWVREYENGRIIVEVYPGRPGAVWWGMRIGNETWQNTRRTA